MPFGKLPAGAVILLLSLLGWLLWLLLRRSRSDQSISPIDRLIQEKLQAAGVDRKVARFWNAVSRLETGDYTSKLFREANNLFGMTMPKKRRTTAYAIYQTTDFGNLRDFAKFRSLADSVDDLVLYLGALRYPVNFPTVDAFVAFMKSKGYFELDEMQYLAGVKAKLMKVPLTL